MLCLNVVDADNSFTQVLAVDDEDVANDGTIYFREDERIAFSYLTSRKFLGDEIALTVLREGKVVKLTLHVRDLPPLVPLSLVRVAPNRVHAATHQRLTFPSVWLIGWQHDKLPSYLVHAGLVCCYAAAARASSAWFSAHTLTRFASHAVNLWHPLAHLYQVFTVLSEPFMQAEWGKVSASCPNAGRPKATN